MVSSRPFAEARVSLRAVVRSFASTWSGSQCRSTLEWWSGALGRFASTPRFTSDVVAGLSSARAIAEERSNASAARYENVFMVASVRVGRTVGIGARAHKGRAGGQAPLLPPG